MEILTNTALRFISKKCVDEYFIHHNFLDVPCFKSTLSKGLGFGIILGSVMVKLPQIIKITNSKSGKGINIFAVCLELFAISASLAYSFVNGFPFSAWGEGTFLALQTSAIAALVIFYGGATRQAIGFIVSYAAVMFILLSGLTPVNILWFLQATNVPIILMGKLIQAHTNYKNCSTGQLSAPTCFLLFFGSLMRIFTSIQETGDFILILTYCVASLANGIIVSQLIWYWNADETKKKKKQ